jgi:hypothetical protein
MLYWVCSAGQVAKSANQADRHTGDILCLAYHAGRLYTGGDDGFIKVLICLIIFNNILFVKMKIKHRKTSDYVLYSTSCLDARPKLLDYFKKERKCTLNTFLF